jgi:hypothetical protein
MANEGLADSGDSGDSELPSPPPLAGETAGSEFNPPEAEIDNSSYHSPAEVTDFCYEPLMPPKQFEEECNDKDG